MRPMAKRASSRPPGPRMLLLRLQGALVYELMAGGSLDAAVFGTTPPPGGWLPWSGRVRVAVDVASALCCLHTSPQPIVHM